jgi:hypothetical protein
MHGIGSLISVQHSSFLQAEVALRNAQLEAEKNGVVENDNQLIL